jgi:hypothetical protein
MCDHCEEYKSHGFKAGDRVTLNRPHSLFAPPTWQHSVHGRVIKVEASYIHVQHDDGAVFLWGPGEITHETPETPERQTGFWNWLRGFFRA